MQFWKTNVVNQHLIIIYIEWDRQTHLEVFSFFQKQDHFTLETYRLYIKMLTREYNFFFQIGQIGVVK